MEKLRAKKDLLFWSVFFVFLGRGLQLIFWDAPYRSIIWDQQLTGPFIEFFMSWHEFTSWLAVDRFVSLFTRFQGVFLIISAFALFYIRPKAKTFRALIHLASLQLLLVAIAGFWHSHHQWPYLLEYSLQVGVGQLYLKSVSGHAPLKWAKVLVAFTFIGHGAYALGIYPTPGRFFDMILAIVDLRESHVRFLLNLAGSFDIVFGVALIFTPRKFERLLVPFLFIAGCWGLLTASARWLSYVEYDFFWMSLKLWGPEVLYRISHGLVPFWLVYQTNHSTTTRNYCK
jgi:hypothetical protein